MRRKAGNRLIGRIVRLRRVRAGGQPERAAQISFAIFQSPKATRATMIQKTIVSGSPTSTAFTTPSFWTCARILEHDPNEHGDDRRWLLQKFWRAVETGAVAGTKC